jgi:hypothetical protein
MKSLYPRCGALDVHKETVVACARVQEGTRVTREGRCERVLANAAAVRNVPGARATSAMRSCWRTCSPTG